VGAITLKCQRCCRSTMRENGVGAEQIEVIADEHAAIQSAAREMAGLGDLLLLWSEDYAACLGANHALQAPMCKQSMSLREGRSGQDPFETTSAGSSGTIAWRFVRDERGVRLRRERWRTE